MSKIYGILANNIFEVIYVKIKNYILVIFLSSNSKVNIFLI